MPSKNSVSCLFLILWAAQAFQPHRLSVTKARNSFLQISAVTDPRRQEKGSVSLVDVGKPTRRTSSHQRRTHHINNRRPKSRARHQKVDVFESGKWDQAVKTESKLLEALEGLQQSIKLNSGKSPAFFPLAFPGIRECNAALAAFGDGGDLLRALKLFVKMRKATGLIQRNPEGIVQRVPTPSLVTYSTIMSRALRLGKPVVALRLWKLMRQQADFYTNLKSSTSISPASSTTLLPIPSSQPIVPDVKAANILMNCYAKMGDVPSALELLEQMKTGNGSDVPAMEPNLITYNTVLDACHKAGDLDTALQLKDTLLQKGLHPDATTYTTLIASVARKANAISGANDPTIAFSLLQEMRTCNIRPNGMTYSALIDACGRCQRSDLALKGLRLMMQQKEQEQSYVANQTSKHTLPNEVGAWTAAIHACAKASRMDSAVKLFYAMPNFGVYPNTVTCGCLTDGLLRSGRTADTLDVLRYMKKYRIAPSEVMYTSLMNSAGKLVQFENEQQNVRLSGAASTASTNSDEEFPLDDSGATKGIEVYTELLTSLMTRPKKSSKKSNKDDDSSSELMRIFLVVQEMKNVGAQPDLACYNTLLKACAKAGDVQRAQGVLQDILQAEDIEPNDNSWRHTIRAAGKAGRSDIAISTWKNALELRNQEKDKRREWRPSVGTFSALISALLHSAEDSSNHYDDHTSRGLWILIVRLYRQALRHDVEDGDFATHLLNRSQIVETPGLLLMVLRAVQALEDQETDVIKSQELRRLGSEIVGLELWKTISPYKFNPLLVNAYKTATQWKKDVVEI